MSNANKNFLKRLVLNNKGVPVKYNNTSRRLQNLNAPTVMKLLKNDFQFALLSSILLRPRLNKNQRADISQKLINRALFLARQQRRQPRRSR